MASALPTRIPYSLLYDRYHEHTGAAIKRLRLPPSVFCEALVLALDIKRDAFKLGRSKLFFEAGAGKVLEQMTEQSSAEAVATLMERSETIRTYVSRYP